MPHIRVTSEIPRVRVGSVATPTHLWVVDFKNLEPDPVALNHAGELGREMISDAFLSEYNHPLVSFMGIMLVLARGEGVLRIIQPTLSVSQTLPRQVPLTLQKS